MREELRHAWIRSAAELEQLERPWSELWKRDPGATPFQHPAWLLPWWHCFGEELRTVATFRGDDLVALLLFYIHREPRSGEHQLLPVGVGTTDYLDGIFAPDMSVAEVGAAVEFLCDEDGWDGLYVSQLRAGSKLLRALEAGQQGERLIGQSCSRMPAVPLSALPQKIRRNAMYYRNRALRAGNLELDVAGGSNWGKAFAVLMRLHGERWRDRGEPGVFADERVVRWHEQALPRLERAGLLRLCSLRLEGGEIMGVLYALIDPPGRPERTQYFYLPAYSIRHADLRPGTLLTALAVEHAAGEGVQTIDMLRGDEEYKKLWHTERAETFGFARGRRAGREESLSAGDRAA